MLLASPADAEWAAFLFLVSGDYFEAGYSATVAEIDLGVTLIFNDKDLSGTGESDEAIVFTVGKAFDIK